MSTILQKYWKYSKTYFLIALVATFWIVFGQPLPAQNLPVVWIDDDWPGPWKGTEAEPCSTLQQAVESGSLPIIPNYHLSGLIVMVKPGTYNNTNFNLASTGTGYFAFNGNQPTNKTFIFRAAQTFNQNPNTTGRVPNSLSEARIVGQTVTNPVGTNNTIIFEGFTFENSGFTITTANNNANIVLRNNIFTGNLPSTNQFQNIASFEYVNNRVVGVTSANHQPFSVQDVVIGNVTVSGNEFLGGGSGNALASVTIQNCKSVSVQNNKFVDFNPAANTSIINVTPGTPNNNISVQITDNSFNNVSITTPTAFGCIYVNGSPNSFIQRNAISSITTANNNTRPLIFVEDIPGGVGNVDNTLISENTITNCQSDGGAIHVKSIRFPEVKNNSISAFKYSGATITAALLQAQGGVRARVESNTLNNVLENSGAAFGIRIGGTGTNEPIDSAIVTSNNISQVGSSTALSQATCIEVISGVSHRIENNTLASTYSQRGIRINSTTALTAFIRNNILTRVRGNRIEIDGPIGGRIENNLITDFDAAATLIPTPGTENGIYVRGGNSLSIYRNNITNMRRSGIYIEDATNLAINTVTIQENNIDNANRESSANDGGIYFNISNNTATTTLQILNNSITNNKISGIACILSNTNDPILRNIRINYNILNGNDAGLRILQGGAAGHQLDATGNWWGGSDALGPFETTNNTNPWNASQGQSIITTNKIVAYSPWLGGSNVPDDDLGTIGVQLTAPKDWYVAELYGGNTPQNIPGQSTQGTPATVAAKNLIPRNNLGLEIGYISKAIQLGKSGDRVWVHPGVYRENITFPANTQWTLNAIKYKDVSPFDINRSINVDLNQFGFYNINEAQIDQNFLGNTITIGDNANVTINGFTINASVNRAVEAVGTSANVVLKNCLIDNRGSAAILTNFNFTNHTGEIIIDDCRFRSGSFSPGGIMLSLTGVKKGSITDNVFDGRRYVYQNGNPVAIFNPNSPASASATAIRLDGVSNVEVDGNLILYHSQSGIFAQSNSGPLANLNITYNEVWNNNTGNAINQGGITFFSNNASNVNIARNILRNNLQNGLVVQSASSASGLKVERNLFHNNNYNAGTMGCGIRHEGSGTLEATNNWWGVATGPQVASNPVGGDGTPRLNPDPNAPISSQTTPRQQILGASATQVVYSPWLAGNEDDQTPNTRPTPYNVEAFNGTVIPDDVLLIENNEQTYGYQDNIKPKRTATVCDFMTVTVPSTSTCTGSNAQLSATVSKGIPTYVYNWSGPGIVGSNTGSSITVNLPTAGVYNYTVTVTDANNCVKTANATVTVAQSLSVSIQANNQTVSSFNLCRGASRQLQVLPNVSGYTYTWSGTNVNYLSANNISNPTITLPANATPANLTVVVSDGSCTGSASLIVNPVNNNLVVNINGPSSICAGTTAQLTAIALGGATEYKYNWSSVPANGFLSNTTISNPTVNNPVAGSYSYTVNVTDANSCTASANFNLSVSSGVIVNAGADQTICQGDNTKSLAASISFGTAQTISWSCTPIIGLSFLSNTNTLNPAILNATPGSYTYRITVTDANNCSNTDEVVVNVVARPVVAFGGNISFCVGTSQQLTPTVTGGQQPYSYSWSATPPAATGFLNNVSAPNPTILNAPAGTYTYAANVTDANGCTANASIVVTVNALPTVVVDPNFIMCTQSSRQLNASIQGGGTASFVWSSNPAVGITFLSNTTIANPIINNPTAGSYVYTATATDVNGCTGSASVNVTVISSTLTISAGDDVTMCVGDSRQLTATVSGSIAQSFSWTPTTGLVGFNTATPTVSGLATGTYTYTASATDANGCTRSDEVVVRVVARPTASFGAAPAPVCAGTDVQLVVNLSGTPGFTVRYTEGGEVRSFTATSTPYTLTVRPNTTTIYSITEVTDAICTATGLNSIVTVPVRTLPTATISGDVKGCSPIQPATLTLNLTGQAPFTVRYRSGAGNPTVINNINTSPFNFTVTPTEAGRYTYTLIDVVDNTGCVSTQVSGEGRVSISPPTSVEFGGVASTQLVCQGEQALLLVDLIGTPPFSLTYTENNGSPVVVNNIQRSPFGLVVTPSAGGIRTFRITGGTDANGCALGSAQTTRSVNVLPATTASISGGVPASICGGQSSTITVNFTGIQPFFGTYRVNGGEEIPLNNGNPIFANTFTFTVTPTAQGNNTYTLGSVSSIYCGTGQISGTATVNVTGQGATATLSAPEQQITLGQTAELTVVLTGRGPWSFQYREANNNPITVSNINGTSPFTYRLVVTPTAVGDRTYILVSVTDANNCGAGQVSGSATVRVLPAPCPNSGFPITATEGCGDVRLSTAFVGSEFSYQWLRAGNTVGTSQTLTATQSGTYELRLSKAGCATAISSINVTVIPAPTATVQVTNETQPGANDGRFIVSVTPAGSYIYN
ncbi:MAG: right-handed parallel beta-helix repeat-containing protein, partial [Bacteroidia bacterium]|nr:right-handed parallel beta-helix repeat-containing protein [Bacteroidia bacterium]MDW8158100.1 right-handed parallel beta-helix repeat-containing protein [Bacteroidia bacterium]